MGPGEEVVGSCNCSCRSSCRREEEGGRWEDLVVQVVGVCVCKALMGVMREVGVVVVDVAGRIGS